MMLIVLFFINQNPDLQKLYNHATTSLVQFKAEKDTAFNQLVNMAQDTIYEDTIMYFLISQFDTKSASERHALKDMMLKIGIRAIPFIVDKIDYRGSDIEDRCLKQSLWVLGEIGGEGVVEPAARFIDDVSWQIRSNAYTTLGKSKSAQAIPAILSGLEDTVASVRKSAYYALSELATIDELEHLINGLGDEHYGVRYACVKGLTHLGEPASTRIVAGMNDKNTEDYFFIITLARIPEASDDLLKYLNNTDPAGRCLIYEAIKDITILEMAAEWETNSLLSKYLKVKIKDLENSQ